MSLLRALASGRPLLMDGAMGTALLAAGIEPTPACVLTHADRIHAVHASHVAAGALVVLTCTFQSNPVALTRLSLEGQLERINARAVHIARRAAPGRWVLGDVGPIGSPGRPGEFADRQALRRTIASLEDADGILFETCSTPAALTAIEFASHRIPEVEGKPLLLSLSYHRNAVGELVTWSGHPPETYARHAARHSVSALGINCGRDIDLADVALILRRYRDHTDLPLFARPNAGTPDAQGQYPRSPEQFAVTAELLTAAGARMLGGCCGTTAEHIRAIRQALAP